ncbi:GntR family transcriptional regulator [Bradyrhizobium sp. CCGUVB1N3]|uniref:GntR family transcriptional regulator n=1 Tax=Bradyrhizobium sp. CCGUVB1N3 TaxID=2949629 RepID=UPI0020B1CF7A|nr:GntR family transcriptional regulator [Bradyrhizobium sp. CCGUVB1N3]MCP3474089.1 GntR family transcriptional regulator [Bradyrhizobium sp. CCGUVB1N3]
MIKAVRGGSKSSLRDAAYEKIKRMIVTLELSPGERLNEQTVSDLVGIGRTPVHQALQLLDAQGFVKIIPRKGLIVQHDSLNDALTVLEARVVIETELARMAAQRASPGAIGDLEASLGRSRKSMEAKDFQAFMDSDWLFHNAIASAASNAILSEMFSELHARVERIWYLRPWKLENLKRTHEEHSDVFRAIANRKPEAAAEAMRAHLDTLRASIVDLKS